MNFSEVMIFFITIIESVVKSVVKKLIKKPILQVGDLIETHLVQIRDIDKVMKSAKTGSMKERRGAAFELASLAATGDDTKFRIVQEGG